MSTLQRALCEIWLGTLPNLRRCDVVLLGGPEIADTDRLLAALEPRASHRVRSSTRGEDVARLARRLTGRSIGLSLSGGGARSFAQLGVIDELAGAGITIDRVSGTSMGAFIGALVAQGLDPAEIDARCYEEWVRRNPANDYHPSRKSVIRRARARAMLEVSSRAASRTCGSATSASPLT